MRKVKPDEKTLKKKLMFLKTVNEKRMCSVDRSPRKLIIRTFPIHV